MAAVKRVLLVFDTRLPHRRRSIAGVIEYAREHAAWELIHVATLERLDRRWMTDGLIGLIAHTEIGPDDLAERLGVPAVAVGHGSTRCPRVQVDDTAVGQMAATHLLELQMETLAVVTMSGIGFSDEREAAVRRSADLRDIACYTFDSRGVNLATRPGQRALEGWLKDLPKPAGVLAVNIDLGQQVIAAANHLGIAVPDELAVLGVGDDELLCRLTVPALSAIEPSGWQLGYEAGRLLHTLLRGGSADRGVVRVPPADLTPRRSTDTIAVPHPDARQALGFIRRRATEGILAKDVFAQVPASRRTLETAFRRYVGRSIYEEITRVRVEHAKRLLRTTERSVLEVAVASGFSSGARLAATFKRVVGQTPQRYRRGFSGRAVQPATFSGAG